MPLSGNAGWSALAIGTIGNRGVRKVYAIISDGSHQYLVEEGMTLEVQRKDIAEDQKTIEFDRILMIGDVEGGAKFGEPTVEGAIVTAAVVREMKADKIIVQKFRRRKGYAVKQGHRQKHLQVKIEKISH